MLVLLVPVRDSGRRALQNRLAALQTVKRHLGELSPKEAVLFRSIKDLPEWSTFSPSLVSRSSSYRQDDTPHVPDEKLGEEKVLHIIENLTSLIKETFPDTKVYAAMGNHDFHPKNQFPGRKHRIYNRTAELWRPWLSDASIPLFRAGAFYSEKLPGTNARGRMVVLNTNLYYDQNDETAGEEDPGGQFQWLEETLTNASRADEMVYIVGHVPPGFFEKKRGKSWFRSRANERYLEIVRKHHRVIAAQFFGHHHTDSFRMFYSDTGSPINVMFLAPGVTPWKTTLPGVNNGANNPGIRVVDYDPDTLQVLDMVTYYFNLSRANMMAPTWEEFPAWEEEYRLTEAFQVPDGSARSMQAVLEGLWQGRLLQLYHQFNSVSYDLSPCEGPCRLDHVCAIREVDFTKYKECTSSTGSAIASVGLLFFCFLLGCLSAQQVL
ncbi:acid sphingomyelinase-like phosphodiesterase 3b isoform X2 [Apus apus]|uniref:acid sphingomyelinase-like phosphodiesterase 3b isoform X2 n=1 Tax=Apus apus TaxID=8895 RepID=UPI0021F88305|nr:acid sphingomyelinase-like phosphodiesterase 3b isoform X2 [Apus apus]XP_051494163.1 acid sphingomyelinase-like phosphodiesterase 3b isoform X2 [Apus apus]XP_051494164.1 acid sphingomyelinase-like phosphodiesterase 3b isoform X2 [Apus apus]